MEQGFLEQGFFANFHKCILLLQGIMFDADRVVKMFNC